MKFTENYNLPCLENEDYGAYAIYMQCLAETLDAKFQQQFDDLYTFLQPPASVWTRTTTQTGIVNSASLTDLQLLFIFETESQLNWPFPITTTPNIPTLRGWWHVGMTVNLQASGAVNADTIRQIYLRGDAVINEAGVSTTNYVNFVDQVWESNTGNGENLTVQGTVFQPGFDEIILQGWAVHQNTSSTLTMTITPQPRLWAVYLGDTPEIAQVG